MANISRWRKKATALSAAVANVIGQAPAVQVGVIGAAAAVWTVAIPQVVNAQSNTYKGPTGNWSTPTNWASSNFPVGQAVRRQTPSRSLPL